MQEWDVVGVIAVLVALFSAAVAPMLKLTQAIARLTATVEQLEKSTEQLARNNQTTHARLWESAHEQGTQISDHESRIRVLEET